MEAIFMVGPFLFAILVGVILKTVLDVFSYIFWKKPFQYFGWGSTIFLIVALTVSIFLHLYSANVFGGGVSSTGYSLFDQYLGLVLLYSTIHGQAAILCLLLINFFLKRKFIALAITSSK